MRVGEDDTVQIAEIILLQLVHDAVHEVHPFEAGRSVLRDDAGQSRTQPVDTGSDGLRNGMILPMEYVDHDGPSVELVDSHVRFLWKANVRLHHDGRIGQRDGGSFFHDGGLLDLGLNSMHIRVALAHDGERGETDTKFQAPSSRLVATEHIGQEGWSHERGTGGVHRNATRLDSGTDETCDDPISCGLGSEGEQTMDGGKPGFIGHPAEAEDDLSQFRIRSAKTA